MSNNNEKKGFAESTYTASDISVLEGLEHVRLRPGMYIDSTGEAGLHHLVWEIIDNSIDEALAGFCDRINVVITKNNEIKVEDNGRGIPTEIHAKTGVSTVETVFANTNAGGKFGNGGYKVAGGLHGVGASAVNALSEYFEVHVFRNGIETKVRFEYDPSINKNRTVIPATIVGPSDKRGTSILFKPDQLIFVETTTFDFNKIDQRIRRLAYLNKGLTLTLFDERDSREVTYCYEGGLRDYVAYLNETKTPLYENIYYQEGFRPHNFLNMETKEEEPKDIGIEIAFQYNTDYSPSVYCFTNNVINESYGTHEEGFRLALQRVVNKYAIQAKLTKESDESFKQEDCREGLTAIISIKHPSPEYRGQTKGSLGNPEVKQLVSQFFGEGLEKYLLENPKDAERIVNKILSAQKARKKAEEARLAVRKTATSEFSSLPGKLADCSSKDVSKCEIFIVEGDSAGGSAIDGRNRTYQAILPLRGKVLNVEKASPEKILGNEEIGTMIKAFGVGYSDNSLEHTINLEKLRYNRIVIMTDADVDGSHIRILLLTFFYRFLKDLITNGHIYIAQPPLYLVKYSESKLFYAYSDAELDKIREEYGKEKDLQRYKGLGEMDPQQLWETTMDPKRRVMTKITIEDALEADRIIDMLMGNDSQPRKEFITKEAKFVTNIDF